MATATTATRRLRLRYPSVCSVCKVALPPQTEAVWNRELKQATCLACADDADGAEVTDGAGRSAHVKAEKLAHRAVRQAQRRWGDEAAAVAATIARDDPTVRAWEKGSSGETRLAAYIKCELGDAVMVLHDRLIPGTRAANIDHLFVAPTGVWVVDAKSYTGKVEKRDVGPLWRQEFQLVVAGRNRTKLADKVALQLKAVKAALEPDPAYGRFAIQAALCFVDSEWGLLARPFEVRGVTVLYPSALRDRLQRDGNVSRETMERLAGRLARALPPSRAALA